MSSKGKMTAVEWLISKLYDYPMDDIIMRRMSNALEMEKEQIIDFHVNCMEDGYNIETEKLLTEDLKLDIKAHAEKYFNKTFKSE